MADSIPASSRLAVTTREHFRCARCGGPAINGQWHHRRSRSVKDHWTHSPANGVWLSAKCHAWVHAHPLEARQTGFIISRFCSDPSEKPVKLWHGWSLLFDDGSMAPADEPEDTEGGQASVTGIHI